MQEPTPRTHQGLTGRMINPEPFDDRPATIQDGVSITGDKTGARWSTLSVEIPRALATGRLSLLPNARAIELEHAGDGRISAVVYVGEDGQRKRVSAEIIILAGNCVESSRLLLTSRSGHFPNGVGNVGDNVGRYYQRHVVQTVWSKFDFPVNMHRGDTMAGLIEDYVQHDAGRGYVGGFYVELNAMGLPSFAQLLEPGWWGTDFAALMEDYAHFAGLYMTGEDMPQATNRILLSDELDPYGVPVAIVDYTEHANDVAMRVDGWEAGGHP